MLCEPSTLTVVPLGTALGNGKLVGLAAWANLVSGWREAAIAWELVAIVSRAAETRMTIWFEFGIIL